jgi:subtilase family serine protease
VAALAPGATDAGSASVTIPAATAAGTYYLFAKADGDDAVAETSEANNTFVAYITIGVDLVVSSLTVPAIGGAGFAMTLTDTTRNQGSGTAPASTTTFYLSSDTLLDGTDVVLGSRAVPVLASGASDTGSVTVTIPAGVATGTYFVFAKADSGSVVSEVSEGNNTAFRTIKVGPDLLVSGVATPTSVLAGSTISVTDTTGNGGGGSSAASTTRFYLSVNNVLDAGDAIVGSRSVGSLAPGTSEAGPASLTIPASTPSGYYYLFAKADADGALTETSENNNTYAVVIQITH